MISKNEYVDAHGFSIDFVDEVLLLLDDGKWHKGKEITRALDITPVQLRRITSQTGLLISSVNCGYMLIDFASQEDFEECVGQLEHRIRGIRRHIRRLKMQRRAAK